MDGHLGCGPVSLGIDTRTSQDRDQDKWLEDGYLFIVKLHEWMDADEAYLYAGHYLQSTKGEKKLNKEQGWQ